LGGSIQRGMSMTSFEYLSAIVAIVVALGIAQILRGAGEVALGDGTVRTHWLHSVWLAYLLMVYLHTWVAMCGLRDTTHHTVTWSADSWNHWNPDPAR
jgi:hypothetical protein